MAEGFAKQSKLERHGLSPRKMAKLMIYSMRVNADHTDDNGAQARKSAHELLCHLMLASEADRTLKEASDQQLESLLLKGMQAHRLK